MLRSEEMVKHTQKEYGCGKEGNTYSVLIEIQTGTASVEITVPFLHKARNRFTA